MVVSIITGSRGQDGTYLIKLLKSKGCEIHECTCDILDKEEIFNTISAYKNYDEIEIYNLAARVNVGLTPEDHVYTFTTNSLGILNIMDSVNQLGIKDKCKIFQASSSEIFDKHDTTLRNEKSSRNPQTIYGISKYTADMFVKMYRDVYGLHVSTGILFNHESPIRRDKFVTQKIIKGLRDIFDKKREYIELGNIDVRRDWGHAQDYVEAMWLILQQEKPGDYVISSGRTHTIREFIETAVNIHGKDIQWLGSGTNEVGIIDNMPIIKISHEFYRPHDNNLLVGNPYKIKHDLGWNPRFTFSDIIKDMITNLV